MHACNPIIALTVEDWIIRSSTRNLETIMRPSASLGDAVNIFVGALNDYGAWRAGLKYLLRSHRASITHAATRDVHAVCQGRARCVPGMCTL